MSIYENKICPVCKKEFENGDDIVVCPECGTPHHRECYNLIGHCVNKGLHQANYNYYEDTKPIESKKSDNEGEYYSPNNEDKGEERASIPNPFVATVENEYESNKEKIDDAEISDIAVAVKINQKRFIDKFKKINETGKKAGWNWSAFIFGSFYLLYRKMYRLGIGFFSVIVALIFGSNTLIYKLAPEFVKMSASLYELLISGSTPTNEQLEAMTTCADAKNAVMICYGMLGIIFIIHIIIGIIADNCYKNHIIEIVKTTNKQFEDGEIVSAPSLIGDAQMLQDNIREIYLARRGGVTFIAPALALLFISIII